MTQKLNNNQLRQLYFDNPTVSKPFRKREDHVKVSDSKQSFFDTNVSYERFNAKEIKRFEDFFNTYVDPAPQNYIFKEPEIIPAAPTSKAMHASLENKGSHSAVAPRESNLQFETEKKAATVLGLSQLEKDLIGQIELNEKKVLPIEKAMPTENVDVKDDDLLYLEALVSSRAKAPEFNSLSDLFAEIVDNEKESISNYESSVFDANIQMLFDEDEALPPLLQPEAPEELEISTIPTFDLELPPLPETAKMVYEPTVSSAVDFDDIKPPEKVTLDFTEVNVDAFVEPDVDTDVEVFVEPDVEVFIEASVEEFIPEERKRKKQKKNSKMSILDTILVLIILAIITVLAYSQRHLLPFDLPF